jgi:hypothetical protein
MDLPHSDACFVRAYPAATAEAWVDGHVHAFAFFGKVPLSVLYDNDRCLVSKILPDGTRQRATLFSGFLSHYLFRDRYGRPGKGNDKGKVEGLVGYSRRNFMVPIPRFATWDAFNAHLEPSAASVRPMSCGAGPRPSESASRGIWPRCPTAGGAVRRLRPGHRAGQLPGAGALQDQRLLGPGRLRPSRRLDPRLCRRGRDRLRRRDVIARHPRCYDREDMVFDPVHYLPLIEQKINALDQAAPLGEWDLPPEFATLRRLMEARMIKAGRREYVQVLRLLETFGMEDLHAAVQKALQLGAVGFDAVKHLVLCQVEKRPPKLDLDVYPYLPRAMSRPPGRQLHGPAVGDAA